MDKNNKYNYVYVLYNVLMGESKQKKNKSRDPYSCDMEIPSPLFSTFFVSNQSQPQLYPPPPTKTNNINFSEISNFELNCYITGSDQKG